VIFISSREKVVVDHKDWKMIYFSNGDYFIYKNGKEVAHGRYDAVIADSYNNEMSEEDSKENLTRDLVSWVEKAINKKVVD
jgi:hypothetical protein